MLFCKVPQCTLQQYLAGLGNLEKQGMKTGNSWLFFISFPLIVFVSKACKDRPCTDKSDD